MAVSDVSPSAGTQDAPHQREVIYRHGVVVRATHWINVVCLALLLLSGLQIFNAHPALYWGNYGYRGVPSVISISAATDPASGEPIGVTRVAGWSFVTTGVLGVSHDSELGTVARAFPTWLTLPGTDLGLARDWHFLIAWLLVANGGVYLLSGVLSGHFRRDLAPAADQLAARRILADLWDHIRLRVPRGEAARRYNLLQKIAYLTVVFLLLPVMVLSGLTMSPAVTAAVPGLLDLFGGRQSARTIHFLVANLLVLFVLVHVLEVFVAGVVNGMRSMITGRYVIRPEVKP
ncbi:MAG TPA: cytochrome b/b6 domain-containing protein [Xanthobacteraceae bacterium]|jgi:thiosulfate reductase cytochrome b subunit|nr:cytochrome b/b6 domain-containing protein [Xanthobacteraceae bacterium]